MARRSALGLVGAAEVAVAAQARSALLVGGAVRGATVVDTELTRAALVVVLTGVCGRVALAFHADLAATAINVRAATFKRYARVAEVAHETATASCVTRARARALANVGAVAVTTGVAVTVGATGFLRHADLICEIALEAALTFSVGRASIAKLA